MSSLEMPLGSQMPEGYEKYFAYPASIFQLPDVARDGMIPLGIIASFSFLATFSSIIYMIWRLITSANSPREVPLYRNQLLLLIFNLLLADMFQAMSFMFSFHWYALDMILAPSGACWAQAWFLHLGNIASGSFILAIALHTWYKITRYGHSLSFCAFVCSACAIWCFSVLVATLGPLMRGSDDFVRAGLWCWINVKYETDRLSLHYVWIFIYEFCTIMLYSFIWLKLYKHARECRNLQMHQAVRSKIERSQKFMAVYPVIYVVFTLPLACGRMWSMAHGGKPLPDAYMVVAGCFMASCGWMDALMYTIARGVFHTRSGSGSESYSQADLENNRRGRGDVVRVRDTINRFDETTGLRSTQGDYDFTPSEAKTTTVIVGGQDVDAVHDIPNIPPKSHRILGIGRKTSTSKPRLGRFEEIEDEKDLIEMWRHAGDNNPHRMPSALISDDLDEEVTLYNQHEAASASGSHTSGSSTAHGEEYHAVTTPPAQIPFGQIKKETTIRTTHVVT